MPQTSAAPRPTTDPQESTLLDPFLRLAGNLRDTHVLIVADHGLGLMRGLIQRGCLAATNLRAGEPTRDRLSDLLGRIISREDLMGSHPSYALAS